MPEINRSRLIGLAVCLIIMALTLALYWQVTGFNFINFDDPAYVYDNDQVNAGLSIDGIKWALTATQASNWHPVTWFSHMLDVSLFGHDPGLHHLTNVIIHIINSILLFIFFWGLTNKLWQSAFLAALFALHPMHVESVAWISERKDVLSAFFMLMTLLSYSNYVRQVNISNYLVVFVMLVLGLMTKPMLVTLPLVLLLMDFWPLCRIAGHGPEQKTHMKKISVKAAIYEKLPLLFLAAGTSVITIVVQRNSGAIKTLEVFPLSARIGNALVAYVLYIKKLFWPVGLAIIYPHPGTTALWKSWTAAICMIGISIIFFRCAKRFRFLAVGWCWFIITLVPVIGLVQVGNQSMADRYTYIPFVGLFIIVAYGVPLLFDRWHISHKPLFALSFGAIMGCTGATYAQLGYWQNSRTLFSHALKVTDGNFMAHNYLGNTLAELNKPNEAISHYQAALQIYPNYVEALGNLGMVYATQQREKEAGVLLTKALQLSPLDAELHNNMGNIYESEGDYEKALWHYKLALSLKPNFAGAVVNLANILKEQGDLKGAAHFFQKAITLKPKLAEAHNGLGVVLARNGQLEEAVGSFKKALEFKQDYLPARDNLAAAMAQLKNKKRKTD